eukprot:10861719-Ditylum_brightwellii.AAC.1
MQVLSSLELQLAWVKRRFQQLEVFGPTSFTIHWNYGFKKVETETTKVLDKLSGNLMDFDREKEIEATLEANLVTWTSLPYDKRQGEKPISYLDWKTVPTKNCPVIMLAVIFDTGWQYKGS